MLASLLLISSSVSALVASTGSLHDLASPANARWAPSNKAVWYFPDSVTCPYTNFFAKSGVPLETYYIDTVKQLALAGSQDKDAASVYFGNDTSSLDYPD